jgi:hypothetical protein
MRIVLLGALAVAAGLCATAPSRADVGDDFMTACMTAYGEDSNEFCTCKTEQARLLADEEMMRHFIAFYQDPNKFREDVAAGKVPEPIQDAWPRFVMQSNKICLTPTE